VVERDALSAVAEAALAARFGDRDAACVAVCVDGAEPVAAWRPRGDAAEPAFLVYSIGKLILAAVVLRFVEHGRLALGDSLARYFPAVPGAERITLEHLLRHTAGIPNYGPLPAYHEAVRTRPSQPWSFDDFAAHTWRHGLRFEPGARFEYSNPGYMLVRAILERVGGASHADLVAVHVAAPLGLRRTRVAETLDDLRPLAPAPSILVSADGAPRDVRGVYHPGWVAHGVVASTASEIALFADAFFGGRLVSAASVRRATELGPVTEAGPRWRAPGYGLGVMGDRASPFGAVFGHNGGGPGYDASVFTAASLRGRRVTACALSASETDAIAEDVVFDALARAAERL
jgi:D-alanyl-D-alanine carboxypeptidase